VPGTPGPQRQARPGGSERGMTDQAAGRRPRVIRPATALAVGVLTVAMLAAAALIAAAAHKSDPANLGEVVLWFSFGIVGVVVAWHQPCNPMGWVLMGSRSSSSWTRWPPVTPSSTTACTAGGCPRAGWPCCWPRPGRPPSCWSGWPSCCSGRADGGLVVEADAVGLPGPGALWLGGAYAISLGAVISRQHRLQRRPL
jgi:hypothetical protein